MTRTHPVAEALAEITHQITAAGLPTVLDPADLTPPGAILNLAAIETDTLQGYRLDVEVLIVAPDAPPAVALTALSGGLDTLAGLHTPTGPVETIGVTLPSDPTPLPALRVPLSFHVHP